MSAQRASGPARLAVFAAAAVLVVLAAVLTVRLAGRREPARPPIAAGPPPEGRTVDLKERVRHEEYEAGRLVAVIRGDRFFLGPDGRNHLQGSVEVVTFGPRGETVSRLAADEVVYEKGALLFTVEGRVRVEAGGVVLEGDHFDYDKTGGTFGTSAEGRFSSKTMTGRAKGDHLLGERRRDPSRRRVPSRSFGSRRSGGADRPIRSVAHVPERRSPRPCRRASRVLERPHQGRLLVALVHDGKR